MANKYIAAGALTALALLSACSSGPRDAQTLIADSMTAMGSNDLKTIVYSGNGFETCVGQQFDPYVDWRKFELSDVTRSLDLDAMGWRNQDTRVDELQRGGCGAGPVATQVRNQVVQLGENSNWGQNMDFIMLPQGFLKWASTKGATVMTGDAGEEILVIDGGENPDVMAYFDDNDYLTRIETQTDESFLGTIPWTAEFTDWKDYGGVMFPGKIVESQGGRPIYEMDVANAEPNAAVDIAQDNAKGKGKGGFGGGKGKGKGKGGDTTSTEELAPGVHLVKGGYSTLILDMTDYLVIAEAGNGDARVEQVLAEAERLYPGKEIRYVINNHHHHDHSAGLRGWAAKGVTILTHEINADYFREWLANESTLNPGMLEAAGMPEAKIETFGDMHEISDGTHSVQIHRVQDSMHATGMVVIWVPSAGVLLEADEYNDPNGTPGEDINPYHVNLVKNIERLGLNVKRIVPVHYPGDGHICTMAELRAWAGM